MSEDPAPYFVTRRDTDYCATCGERLVVLEHGGRLACHPNEAQYWSPAEPSPKDVRGFGMMTGLYPQVQTSWFDARTRMRISHAPLYLFRRVA